MKKRIPTFLAGMLTTALIGSLGVGALAATGALTIEVNPINIQVNGTTFAPKDATGNSVPVFSYNGTTYAPLRALAEAYGLEVGYDSKANMATVGETATTPIPETPDEEKLPQIIDVQTVIVQHQTNTDDISSGLKYDFYQAGGEIYGSLKVVEKVFSDFKHSSSGYDPSTKSMEYYIIANIENGKIFTASFTKSVYRNCAMSPAGGTLFPLNRIANDLGSKITVEYDVLNKTIVVTLK